MWGFEKTYLMQNTLNLSSSEVMSTYVYKVGLAGGVVNYSVCLGNWPVQFADWFGAAADCQPHLQAFHRDRPVLIAPPDCAAAVGPAAESLPRTVTAHGLTTLFHNQNRIRESRIDMAFMFVNYTILGIFLVAVLYPLIFVVSSSFE